MAIEILMPALSPTMEEGTLAKWLVKEGDVVKAGDTLVRMNAVQATVNAEIARVQYFSARTGEARLTAERDGKKVIVFPPELERFRQDSRVAENLDMQLQLFNARQSSIYSEL